MLLDRLYQNKPDTIPSIIVNHKTRGKHGAGTRFPGQTSGQLAYTRVTDLHKSSSSQNIFTWSGHGLWKNRVWPWKFLEFNAHGGLGIITGSASD